MLTVSVIMIYALLLVNVGNYVSGAAAIATVLNVNLPVAMCIIAVVSTFYYVFGGLKGVAYVTILHSAIKVVGIVLILGIALSLTGGIAPIGQAAPTILHLGRQDRLPTIFAWTFGTVGAIFSTAVHRAGDLIDAAAPMTRAGPPSMRRRFCLPLGIPARPDRRLREVPLSRHEQPLRAAGVSARRCSRLPAGLVTTSLVASIFVSVSTVALAIASLVVRDFYVPYWKPTPEQELKMTRPVLVRSASRRWSSSSSCRKSSSCRSSRARCACRSPSSR